MKRSCLLFAQLFCVLMISSAQNSEKEISLKAVISQMTASDCIKKFDPTDFGYPHYMVAASEMMGELYPSGGTGYDWFSSYNSGVKEDYRAAFFSWYTSYNIINQCNAYIRKYSLTDQSGTAEDQATLGAVYAIRAFCYYILMVLYEPVSNVYTDCSKVIGLTVPIIDENTTEEEQSNNPRVTHSEMTKFILADLDQAEEGLKQWRFEDRTIPDLSVVYGIKAKVYLWDNDYTNAAQYAKKAIDEAVSMGAFPMSATEWEEPTTGFIKARSSWIWYLHPRATSIYTHLTSWLCPESGDDGYASVTLPSIDRALYDKIGESDFRKRTFLNPQKYKYYNYLTSLDRSFIESAPAYLAIKFRFSKSFWGYVSDGETGYYTAMTEYDLPVMRLEEMYLIEAEAVGVSEGLSSGIMKLNDFVKTYRDPNYVYSTEDLRSFQLEVLTQMHIEFWGEGKAFAIAKRLKPGIMQNYTGTNAPYEYQINCKGINPVWNMVIPQDALDKNKALVGRNNPITYECISIPSPIDQYSEGKYNDTGITEVDNDKNEDIHSVFSIEGRKLDHMRRGLNIIKSKDGKTKKMFIK